VARRLLRSYLYLGALLAIAMWASFTFPVLLSSARFSERMIGILAVQPAAIVSALVRLVAWGPSLLIWAFAPEQYSFGMWLAPGLYAGPGSRRRLDSTGFRSVRAKREDENTVKDIASISRTSMALMRAQQELR
jgi:hypothetical protein